MRTRTRAGRRAGSITSLVLTTALALAVGPIRRAVAADPRPNIVFILVDDLRWNALGCMGHPFVKTPNIDRLATEGALFKNAFVTTPYCSPSRGSILTGQYAHTHGIRSNEDRNNQRSHELVTFPLLLQRAGYATAYIGKWHMGDDDSPRPGFDRWVSFKGQGVYVDPPFNMDGKAVKTQGYVTDLLTDRAVEFVKEKRDKPFVLYLAHKAVHSHFTPAERHKNLFADQLIIRAASANDTLEGKPVLTRPGVKMWESFGDRAGARDEDIRSQLRCAVAIDEGVGKLRQALEQTGQMDNTLIVFTSDNGFIWGEHGMGNKMAAYEESIRVPMIARYPKLIKPGTVIEPQVLNIDIAPTFLDIAAQPVPPNMHGRSLLPLFAGTGTPWRTSFLAEYFTDPGSNDVIADWQAVRSHRWKYIHYPTLEDMDELYDLAADPLEIKNLIKNPESLQALNEMKAELQRLLKESS
jgi:N-acetylglucosamine-6-sulfatase